jgi:hypothetical protein
VGGDRGYIMLDSFSLSRELSLLPVDPPADLLAGFRPDVFQLTLRPWLETTGLGLASALVEVTWVSLDYGDDGKLHGGLYAFF